ncbi:hypothetical protein DFO54_11358 [Erwinia sp. AG740]|nr:hypothetical protein DFO54_11358 [Erwinia sp. AG740]
MHRVQSHQFKILAREFVGFTLTDTCINNR